MNATNSTAGLHVFGVDFANLSGGPLMMAVEYSLINVVVCSVIPLPLAGPLVAAGALLFGLVPGMALNVMSSVVAAYISLLLTRSICRPFLLRMIGEKGRARWGALDTAITSDGPMLALLIRLSPLSPMVLTNVLLSLTSLSHCHYLWTTAIGIIPGNLPYAYAAEVGITLADTDHQDPLMITLTLIGLAASVGIAIKVALLARTALRKHGLDGSPSHMHPAQAGVLAEDWCPHMEEDEAGEPSLAETGAGDVVPSGSRVMAIEMSAIRTADAKASLLPHQDSWSPLGEAHSSKGGGGRSKNGKGFRALQEE
jgi:uncharacterized membrane protein YdjX (TVP38/TMEM64 family)